MVSIASIRGRAYRAGSEFVLACDLQFASRENTLLGRLEVGTGVVPAGGPIARLSRLVGRGRAAGAVRPARALGLNVNSGLERRLGRRVVEALPDA